MLRETEPNASRRAPLLKRSLLLSILLLAGLVISGLRGNPTNAIADDAPKPNQPSGTASADVQQADPPDNQERGKATDQSSETVTISALLTFSPQATLLLPSSKQSDNSSEWERIVETQTILLGSNLVFQSALRDKSLANSRLVRKQVDPFSWLRQHFVVARLGKSPIVRIQLVGCPRAEVEEGVKVVKTVLDSYHNEILVNEKIRQATTLDKLHKLRDQTSNELRDKISRYETLARELGGKESQASRNIVQVILGRLERIDMNVERLEEDQLLHELELKQSDGEPTTTQKVQTEFFEQRLAQLEERRKEFIVELRQRSDSSTALTMLKADIEQLREVETELSVKLRSIEMDRQTGEPEMLILQPPAIDEGIDPRIRR